MAAIVPLAFIREAGNTAAGISTIAAIALVVAGAFLGIGKGDRVFNGRQVGWFVVAALVAFLAGSVATINIALAYSGLLAAFGGLGIWTLVEWQPLDRVRRWILAGITLAILAVLASAALVALDAPRVDVIVGTEAAADALARGDNPYSTVTIPNSDPFAPPGSTFDGYFYPPVALVVYSISDWLFGDIRWANVIAIAAFLILLVRPWRAISGSARTVAAGGALAFVLLPFLSILLRYGWTEPLSMSLLAGSALSWRKRPLLAAVLLGFAVASKQYFVLLAPLLLLWNDEYRWKRVAVVGGVVAVTMLPFALMDPQAFWDATIGAQFGRSPRPDSTNIIALGLTPPSWVPALVATTVAVLLGRRGGAGAEFAVAAAAVLGLAFLLGYQAFSNYWVLIVGLCVVAISEAAATPPVGSESEEPDGALEAHIR